MRPKMKKKIRFSTLTQCVCLGEIQVQHVLPNRFAGAIGPFVFLDHVASYQQSLNEPHKGLSGNHPQPCRGVATLTYILAGEVEHFDSTGNHVKLSSGAVHWMKAGNGIIHDESVQTEAVKSIPELSVLRFWINLPANRKTDEPGYLSLQPGDIPLYELGDGNGWLKIISGEYGNRISTIPGYSGSGIRIRGISASRQSNDQWQRISVRGFYCLYLTGRDN
jgi:redox-sensitive bicupin YhaK (pirin superfamily)